MASRTVRGWIAMIDRDAEGGLDGSARVDAEAAGRNVAVLGLRRWAAVMAVLWKRAGVEPSGLDGTSEGGDRWECVSTSLKAPPLTDDACTGYCTT
ncbi:hypothetical protein IMZ48_43475 [Candidatus Bathyarchaeota archaeon]|nr:hypothetical protein [Candidatus Bathyarchaeota archaeon]